MSNSLEALFCDVDDFCQEFEPKWRELLLIATSPKNLLYIWSGLYHLQLNPNSRYLQQIENKPTTKFFVKAPRSGAFTKNLGLVCSQSAVSVATLD